MKQERKVALVTGAGRRMGRHIAVALASAGFDVAVHYHTSTAGAKETVAKIRKAEGIAASYRADLRKIPQISRLVTQVKQDFGSIDLLVNNAAVFNEAGFSQITPGMWDDTLKTNLTSVFFLSQRAAQVMDQRKGGRIVNIASLGGIQAWPSHIPYCVSKAGVIMLTRCLAKALAPGIMVNAIAPGTIDMGEEEYSDQKHVPKRRIPLQAFGKPGDITSMVLYLANVAEYITGQTIIVDGGRAS